MKIIYQLVCSGLGRTFGNKASIRSKKVFATQAEAESYSAAFRKLCCGDDLFDIEDTDKTTVSIAELELQ